MRHNISLFALLLAVTTAGRAMACSQCMCGTPFPADVLGGVVPVRFTYGLEERYLSKSNALDEGPGSEEEREHRVGAFALWRPLNRLAVLARLPYSFKEITTLVPGEAATVDRAHGLGDGEVTAMVGVVHVSGQHPVSLGLVAGAVAPTGANELKDSSGQRLDAHLQTGTGAWTGTAGLNLVMSAVDVGTWEASVLGRVSGTNVHGYRYGAVALYNLGLTSRTWNDLRLLMQLNGRSAARDQLEDGTLGDNTGGTVVYAAPGVRWASGLGVGLEAAVQIPIVQALYGVQNEHTTARLSLTMSH